MPLLACFHHRLHSAILFYLNNAFTHLGHRLIEARHIDDMDYQQQASALYAKFSSLSYFICISSSLFPKYCRISQRHDYYIAERATGEDI